MNVKSVSVTVPLFGGAKTAEELMVYCARVSNPKNQENYDTGHKLLAYCLRNGHWSVFEMADWTVEIETSRAIAAQILRHRSFSFQEFSQRYAEVQGFEPVELRTQDPKNRQASGNKVDDWALNREVAETLDICLKSYDLLLSNGVSRETARMVLPLCTRTKLYMKGNVRSWIHYLKVRTGNGTQKEHQEIARMIGHLFEIQFPVIAQAMKEAQ
jgi:thymidylate synthase (FAD)